MKRRVLLISAGISLASLLATVVLCVRSYSVSEMWISGPSDPWSVARPDQNQSDLWDRQWELFLARGNLSVHRTVKPKAVRMRPGRFTSPAYQLGEVVPEDSIGPRSLRFLRQTQSFRKSRSGHYMTMFGELGVQVDLW